MSDHVSDHEQEQNFDVLRSLSTCKINIVIFLIKCIS